MKKTISLCTIVKNAQDTISEMLESIKGIVDEIIIVDTGSTDKTMDICRSYGARIYQTKWENDFSKLRNFSLTKATGNWILIIDADEVFVGNRKVLDDYMQKDYKNRLPMYFIDIYTSVNSKNKKDFKYFQKKVRFFPNNPKIRFENAIGEDIAYDEKLNFLGLSSEGIALRHFVFGGLKSKTRRNVEILKLALKENPQSFYYNYLMGKECLLYSYFSKALTAFKNALASPDPKDEIYLSDICTDMIKVLYYDGNKEEALNECIRREKICKDNPQYWMFYGFLALKEGDLHRAKKCFETAIALPPPAFALTINIPDITWKPELLLGYVYLRMKDFKNAKIHFEKSLNHTQNEWLLLFYLGVTCKNLKEFVSSEAYLRAAELIVPENHKKDLEFTIFLTYITDGRFDKANEIIQKMVEEFHLSKEEKLQLLDYDIEDNI